MAGSEVLPVGSHVLTEVAQRSPIDVSKVFCNDMLSEDSDAREVADREWSRRSCFFEMPTEVAGITERSEACVDDGDISAPMIGLVLGSVASLSS